MKLGWYWFYLDYNYERIPIEEWNYSHFSKINQTQVLATNNSL